MIHTAERRAELAANAADLRARGLIYRQIADRLGVSLSYAAELCTDPDGTRNRERKRRYAGVCEDCGNPTSGSNGPAGAPRHCAPCAAKRSKIWTADAVVAAIQRFAERYGRPPGVVDFVPALARRLGHEWRAERFYADGDYPAVPTVRKVFDSWAAALGAAGFEGGRDGQYTRAPGCRGGAHLAAERPAPPPGNRRVAERRERVAELWLDGLDRRAIAERLDCTVRAVGDDLTKLRRAGRDLPRRRGGRPEHSAETRERALALYREGIPVRAIGATVGATGVTVRRWARQARLPPRPRRPGHGRATRERALALYRDGVPLRAINAAVGAAPVTIRRWARQEGIPPRREAAP